MAHSQVRGWLDNDARVCFAATVYYAILCELVPVEPTVGRIVLACIAAQSGSKFALVLVQCALGVSKHTRDCRQWTAVYVFSASVIH